MKRTPIDPSIQATVDTIVQTVSPEKIILFGSRAWGTPGLDSDIDLFIVKNTRRSTRDVARSIDRALWGRATPLDIIVSTPARVRQRLKQCDFFMTDVMQKGTVLYDRA